MHVICTFTGFNALCKITILHMKYAASIYMANYDLELNIVTILFVFTDNKLIFILHYKP